MGHKKGSEEAKKHMSNIRGKRKSNYKKGSKEAKEHMAKLRAMRGKKKKEAPKEKMPDEVEKE